MYYSYFAFLIVFVVSCSAPVPKDLEPTLYFPTKVGDRWHYLVTGRGGEEELIEEVTEVREEDGVKHVSICRLNADGQPIPEAKREVSKKGVFESASSLGRVYDKPMFYLQLPHKEGQTWQSESGDTIFTAFGPEKIKVPCGEYDAIRVEERKKGDPKALPIRTEWYAPRVGVVKATTGTATVIMMKFIPSSK